MDEPGLRVMRILIDHGCEPGNDYTDTEVQIWFEEAGLADQDIERGLVDARDKGWLIMSSDRLGVFQVTQAGFDAASAALQ